MPTSATDCVQPALQHARDQLFSRFRWGQWLQLALVGVLAGELHVGGCNFSRAFAPISQPKQSVPDVAPPIFHPPHIDPAILARFVGLILLGVLVVIVLVFIFLYINSVFRFILFDSVLRRNCSIGEGWDRWHRTGGRFFLWQIVFQISAGLFFVILIGVPLALAASAGWFTNPMAHAGRLAGSAFLLLALFLFFLLLAAVVQVLARDFLVPIMAIEDLDFADGWSRLLSVIRPEPGRFVVYLLLKLVLAIAAAIIFGIVSLIPVLTIAVPAVIAILLGKSAGMAWNVTTISLAVILGTLAVLLLVYLISLVSVPATVFFPAYAMYFLAGRYPNLNALLNPVPVVEPPASQSSPLPETPPPLPPAPEPIG